MSRPETSDVTVDRLISARAESLYALVSDVTRMGQWSPETTSCRWLGNAIGPTRGARFRGSNRDGWRRWFTTCTVTEADPGHRFAFDVDFGPLPISRWIYDFVADGCCCVVTETWHDRRPAWMVKVSPFIMGVRDREQHNRDSMRVTLDRLQAKAERAG